MPEANEGSTFIPIHAVPAPAATPAPAAPVAPPMIPLTVEEYQRFRALESKLSEMTTAQAQAIEAKELERIQALAEKGQIQEALETQRKSWETKHAEAVTRYSSLETQIFGERKEATLSGALTGRAFVGETPEQRAATAQMVRRLLNDDFETARDGAGAMVVRDKITGRPATDVIKERLDSPEFAIFFAPSTRGGAGSQGGTAAAPIAGGAQPGTLDSIVASWKANQGPYQSMGLHARTK